MARESTGAAFGQSATPDSVRQAGVSQVEDRRNDREERTRALERLARSESVLITGHRNPDGDVVGSAAVLGTALEALGKRVHLVLPDPAPKYLGDLLEPFPFQVFGDASLPKVDLVCVVDASEVERIGPLGEALFGGAAAPDLLIVDHHLSGAPSEQVATKRFAYRDVTAAATSVLALEIAEALAAPLTPAAADAGLMALISDTGGFRFESTNAGAFEAAARFVRAGARPDRISESTRGRDEPGRPHQVARLLECSSYRAGGRIAFLPLTADVLAETPDADPASVYETLRGVRGVDVVASVRQLPNGAAKLSLRTRAPFSAAALAGEFGGGGHVRAAGATLESVESFGGFDACCERVIETLEAAFEDARETGLA